MSNKINEINDTYEDQFMFEIDRAIEFGDCSIILNAIRNYKLLINDNYIKMADNIYQELIQEKFELIKI